MKRRGFLKALSPATAGVLAAAHNTGNAGGSDKPRTFVLVHGAWHGGWCWRRVADVLMARGHRVFAPSLTGVGDRAHLFSKDISLQTHVEDILSLIEAEELSGSVLVGHSYGGLVISGVADTVRERVSRYIYLDAWVPSAMSPGASCSWSEFDTPEKREARLKSAHEQGKDAALPPPPPSAVAVTMASDVAWLQRQFRPMPLRTYIERFTFKGSGSNGLKRDYIAAIKPAYPPLLSTHNRIKDDHTWSFRTLDAGHDSMVTAPAELGSLLMEA